MVFRQNIAKYCSIQDSKVMLKCLGESVQKVRENWGYTQNVMKKVIMKWDQKYTHARWGLCFSSLVQ